jgi:twitching motility protein PilU
MESNTTPAKDAGPAKPPVDPKLAATGPQVAIAPATLTPGDSINAGGGHPTLNTKPLFKLMVEKKASDLFFTSNAPIKIKIEGQIMPVNKQVLTPETVRQTAFALMTAEQREHFVNEFELDFAISEPGLGRFRVNVFMQRGFPAMVLRYITADMPRMESLGLPEIMSDLVLMRRGLVLMVGATGSGKSTSLAAMINYRNENASDHIVTIEDPIEFLHTNKRSIVNQREVGIDTKSYARALRGVVRAAPDVILIGEIRDRESMEAAINLAGTGHLVLATMHANNCAESLDRIINMFPREQHAQIFLDMSQYLRAILGQRLVMGRDGKRVAAVEVMINTPHISELVKKGDVMGIKEAITTSGERGVQSFDASLRDLFKSGRIGLEEALASADSRANLEAKINFG